MSIHPRRDDHGNPVALIRPHQPTPPSTWLRPDQVATAVPGGPLPPELDGIPLVPWGDAPRDRAGWLALAREMPFEAPAFDAQGREPAAGAVVVEADGRVWLAAPSNAFGGTLATFPKGKADGLDLRATALKEVFEETGLKVELLAHLADLNRSTSRTRYFLARRAGGSPADMGWETQAVHLAPVRDLKALLNRTVDHPLVDTLTALPRT